VRILLTGGSSFTGLWFARSLVAAGHTVVAPLKGSFGGYSGLRGERVTELKRIAEVVEDCPFGSASFVDLASTGSWDLLCQHAARTGDYRNPAFDVAGAIAENTHNLVDVIRAMSTRGLRGVVLTGSIFEQDEGAGETPLRAFSPYGLSKGLTWEFYRYLSQTMGFPLGKFVIPNPFGPFEEPRFCNYLIQSWFKGEIPTIRTPLYVRDNIHIDLLAAAYASFVNKLPIQKGVIRLNPSFYVESQGAFAARFATEMAPRLGIACPVASLLQSEFGEPMVRINTDRVDGAALGWSEAAAWEAEAEFYKARRAR
jgi:nucleoside-diphosphate-sugar epimerase